MNAIQVSNLNKRYPGFQLQDVSFALPEGCVLGLMGENGAGKSTTIRLIMNAARRDSGEIWVLGRNNREQFESTKQEIGVVLDEASFPQTLNAKQAGKVFSEIYRKWDAAMYSSLLERFGLPTNKSFKDFSRGMKMKLALAAALSHNARLLLLDEATSGLDPVAREEILEILNDFTREEDHSILISSHILSDLEKICDYIAFLHQGRLLFCEEKDALMERYALVKISRAQAESLPQGATIGIRDTGYGLEVLMERKQVPRGMEWERASIEQIMLYMARGNEK